MSLPAKYSQRYSSTSMRMFYEECEYRFYLIYVVDTEALPEFRAPYELGSNVHNIIQIYYSELVSVPSEAEIGIKLRGIFNRYFNFGLKKTKKAQRIMNNLIKYEVNRLRSDPNDYLPQAVEQRARTAIWTGFYDVRLKNKIIDWKTGSKADPDDRENIIQASVYYHSAKELGYEIDTVEFVFLDSGEIFEMQFIEYDEMIKLVEGIEKAKNKRQFRKNTGKDCYYCTRRLTCQFDNKSRWRL